MTALVASNSTFLLEPANNPANNPSHNPSHNPGILLNSRNPTQPRQPSSSTASSSSSSNSRAPSSNEGDGPSRKIRFAPLPAPRRLDLPSVFYESDSESPLNHPPTSHTTSDSNSQQPPSPRPPSLSLLNTDDSSAKSKSRTWGQKLLRPLLQPLLPSSTTAGDESYSALFRISSRDSTRANPDLSDVPAHCPAPLARRMSTGSRAPSSTKEPDRSNVYTDGAPLMSVMSEGFSSKGRKEGQRMLNGRVYGRRSSASQSGNQPSYEPEFVEWGYGGMGSVASSQVKSRSGPDWAKLQSNGKVLGGNTDIDQEGDDGSGMGWVKRRRAQREQEEKEREARAKPGPDQSLPDIAVHPPEQTDHVDSSRPPLHRQGSDQSSEEHHVYRAVSVPAPHHHHIRHHSHHKPTDGSGSATPTSSPPLSRGNSSNSVPLSRTASTGSHGEMLPATAERLEDAEASSSSSSRSSASIDEEDEEEEEVDTERESSDDEDDDDAEGRITSRCAGVEKISRHKE